MVVVALNSKLQSLLKCFNPLKNMFGKALNGKNNMR